MDNDYLGIGGVCATGFLVGWGSGCGLRIRLWLIFRVVVLVVGSAPPLEVLLRSAALLHL